MRDSGYPLLAAIAIGIMMVGAILCVAMFFAN